MTPEARADADTIWSLLAQIAQAQLALAARIPSPTPPALRVVSGDLLLLAQERTYWRDLALRSAATAAATAPPPGDRCAAAGGRDARR